MAAFIPQEYIEEIISRHDIVDVVEQYVPLSKKSASNYFGLCPFHSEDSPSFSVSPSKQIFYCFGCHKGGNVIKFIQEIEQLSFPEACRLLAERAKITLPEQEDPAEKKRADKRKRLQNLLVEAARYFYTCLNQSRGQEAKRYMLRQRAYSPASLKKFGIGYAPDEWDGLYQHLHRKGYQDQEILELGLVRRSSRGSLFDLFRNRVMFPIFDTRGSLIAFGGRVMDDSKPKYINSPESVLYHKGSFLYGLNFARRERLDRLILCEGYMDCMAFHSAGFPEAVASLGTALTERQVILLHQFAKEVIVAYDSDAAGTAAILRSLTMLAKRGLKVRVLRLPECKDPDEFLKRFGAEALALQLKKALSLIDFRFALAREEASREGRLDTQLYQEKVLDFLRLEQDSIKQELYAKRLAVELDVRVQTVLEELQRRKNLEDAAKKTEAVNVRRNEEEKVVLSHQEIAFLQLILSDSRRLALVRAEGMRPSFFPQEILQKLLEALFVFLDQEGSFSRATWLSLLPEGPETEALQKLMWAETEEKWAPMAENSVDEVLIRYALVQIERLERYKKQILDRMGQPGFDKRAGATAVQGIKDSIRVLKTKIGMR